VVKERLEEIEIEFKSQKQREQESIHCKKKTAEADLSMENLAAGRSIHCGAG
jgi:hypothetical protein